MPFTYFIHTITTPHHNRFTALFLGPQPSDCFEANVHLVHYVVPVVFNYGALYFLCSLIDWLIEPILSDFLHFPFGVHLDLLLTFSSKDAVLNLHQLKVSLNFIDLIWWSDSRIFCYFSRFGRGHLVLTSFPFQTPVTFSLFQIGWTSLYSSYHRLGWQLLMAPGVFTFSILVIASLVTSGRYFHLWPSCVADADVIFSPCFFLFLPFFPCLISAVADWMALCDFDMRRLRRTLTYLLT